MIDRDTRLDLATDGNLETAGYFRFSRQLFTRPATATRAPTDAKRWWWYRCSIPIQPILQIILAYCRRVKRSKVNAPSEVQLVDGNNITFADQDATQVQVDTEVGTFTAATAPTTASSLDELYPAAKGSWYNNTIEAAPIFSQEDGILSFANAVQIGPNELTQADGANTSIRTTAAPTFGASGGELALVSGGLTFTGSLNNIILPSGTRLSTNGSTTWDLTNVTGGVVEFDGTVTGVELLNNTFSGVNLYDNANIQIVPTADDLTVILQNVWGFVVAGSNVTITSTRPITIASDVLATANVTVSSNITLIGGSSVQTTTVFQVPATHPSGRVLLKLVGSAVGTYVVDAEHTVGTRMDLLTVINDVVTPTTYILYYKPTNVLGNNGNMFSTSIVSTTTDNNVDNTVIPLILPISEVLVSAALLEDTSSFSAVLSAVGTGTTSTLSISGAEAGVTNVLSLAILMTATDDREYLGLLANAVATADLIQPALNNATLVDAERLTLSAVVQQVMTAITNSAAGGTLVADLVIGGTDILEYHNHT